MKKIKIASLILAGCMASVLTASCGKTETTGGNNGEKIEISVVSNERSSMEVMQRLIDKYNAENDKNIYISYEVKDDSISDYLKTTYTSKNPPDIHVGMEQSANELAKEAGWYRELPEDLVEYCRENFLEGSLGKKEPADGKYYSVGTQAGGGMKFLWNKDLFRECGLDPENPPKTWDEMREAAKIITEKGNGVKYGFAMPLKDAVFTRYYVMIPGAPSGYYNIEGFDPVTNKFDFTIYEPMIQFLKGVIADGSAFPTPYTLDNDTARAQFAEGNVGMIYGAPWDVGVYNDQFPAKCDWGIAEYPVFDTLKGGYTYGAVADGKWYMSAMSQHPEEQLEVYKWLISEEVAVELLKENAMPASSMKSLANKTFETEKKGAVEFAQRVYPMCPLDAVQSPVSGMKISDDDCYTTIKNILLNDCDVKAELQKLTDTYNKAMDVYAEELKEKGRDIEEYHIPDYQYVIQSEE